MTPKALDSKVVATTFGMKKVLEELDKLDMFSFDIETRSIYSKEERNTAKLLLDEPTTFEEECQLKMIANSSGLSHPSLVDTTHIIFGVSNTKTYVLLTDRKQERMVFDWLVNTKAKLLVHNASYDLKVVYHRTGSFPVDIEDTQQLAKSLINDCNNWNSRVGLKVLMGEYYPPKWGMDTDYEVADMKNKSFLEYCHYDGIACYHLWEILQEIIEEN